MKAKYYTIYIICIFLCFLLILEGGRSIILGPKLHWSLVHECANIFRFKYLSPAICPANSIAENNAKVDITNLPFLVNEEDLKKLIPDMQYSKVMLGNSPFLDTLGSEEARITVSGPPQNTLRLKGGLKGRFLYLKTDLYNPLDPVALSVAQEKKLTQALEELIRRYGFVEADFSTNEYGERVTLPYVDAGEIILIAGDSVAFGAAVNDEEHLASQLQRLTSDKKFVSIAVPGAGTDDSLVLMDEAFERYPGRVLGLVYVFCENDYNHQNTPSVILDKLSHWLQDRKVKIGIVVYQQYLQRTMPEVFRREVDEFITYDGYKKSFIEEAARKNIPVVDFKELVEEHRRDKRSLLAGATLYADQCHFSPEGNQKVAVKVFERINRFKNV